MNKNTFVTSETPNEWLAKKAEIKVEMERLRGIDKQMDQKILDWTEEEENQKYFETSNTLHFENGKIAFVQDNSIQIPQDLNMLEFAIDYPECVTIKPSLSKIKGIMSIESIAKDLEDIGVSVVSNPKKRLTITPYPTKK